MGDKTQNLPISVANVSTFPSSVTKIGSPTGSFEDKEDELDKIYPIQGKLFKSSAYAWLSWGPNLEVVKTATGLKVASCIFDGGLNVNPVITCVAELSPSDGCCAQLAVGIQCEEDSGLVCIYEAVSGNPRIIRTIQMPNKVLSICVVSPGTTYNNTSPLCPLLCSMAGVLAVGLAGARVILVDLKRTARQYPGDMTHQLVSLVAGDSLAEKQSLAARTGDHLSLLLNWDAFSSTHYSLLSSDGTIINKMYMHKVCVTALLYIPQIAGLVVGFNFGCFQIWNLSNLQLEYTSEFLDDPLPVKSLSFQEPSDDPCNCCYLWAVFGTSTLSVQPPLLAMYSLGFKRKQLIPQYGMLYQDFQSCTLSFEHELQKEEVDPSSRFVSCNMIEKTSFTQSIMFDGDDGDVSLCLFAWATPDLCHLSLFDLNQWYKDQMPADITRAQNVNSFWATYSFAEESNRLLDIRLKEETLAPFRAALTQDEHFFPAALTFGSVCLFQRKTISCLHPGIQRAVLKTLSDSGPLGVASPTTIYLQCVEVGLCPRFIENVHRMNVTLEDQRDFLLSLALEHHLERLVLSCATSWADGSQGSLGCSLQLWLKWALQRAYICKTRVDHLCIPLFNHSGQSLDRNSYRELDQCFRQLRLLAELYRDVFNYCVKNPRSQTPQDFEKQMQSLDVVSLYVEVVKWFVNIKLLPEFPEGSEENGEDPRIPYPVTTLSKFYQERRTGLLAMTPMSNLSSSFKKEAQTGCPDSLFIDGLLCHECGGGRLFNLWEQDGGSGLYPPPSLQSLLRTYLLVDVPTHVKHSITLYFFLDLSALLEVQDRYRSVFEHFIKFPAAMGVSSSMIKITQAFWLLDHRDFSEAVEMLRDPLVHWKDLKPWQNQLVIKVLVRHGKNKLALDYIRACGLPMTNTDDIRLMVTLLLSNGFISQAFTFQRKHRTEENATELLQHFFAGCQELNKLNQVLSMVMTCEEEKVFQRFLEGCQHPRAQDLHVMYYLAQSRIVEAVEANDRFHPLLLSSTKRKTATDRNPSFCEEIVQAYAKTIPTATWELARYRPKQMGLSSTWKQVERPEPISMAVKERAKDSAHYRSSLIRTTMERARDTYTTFTVPSPSTPASMQTLATPSRLSRLGTQVQSGMSTPGSSGPKRERNSSESSLLLHTPHVRRITQDTLTLSHGRAPSSVSTPQSILKVRRTLRRSLSRESLPPSVSGTATTPDLDECMEEDTEPVASRSSRLIRFDIPSTDVSVCSSTAEQAQVEGDGDAERAENKMSMEYEGEEEEVKEEYVETAMERGTQTSFIIPKASSPCSPEKKYKSDTSTMERHDSGYFLRSPKRNFVGGTPRKPLKGVSKVLPSLPTKKGATLPPSDSEVSLQSESDTDTVEPSKAQPAPPVERDDRREDSDNESPFSLEIVNVAGGQTDAWESLEKSSESGEEFLSARSGHSLDKSTVASQNMQPRQGYLRSVNVTEETTTDEEYVCRSRLSSSTVVTSVDPVTAMTRTRSRAYQSENVTLLPVAPRTEDVCEVENLPITINTGNLEPDVEIEINVVQPSAAEEIVEPCTQENSLPVFVSLKGCENVDEEIVEPESPGIEVIEPEPSGKEIFEEEVDEEEEENKYVDEENEYADEDDSEDYCSEVPVVMQRKAILPDNSIYVPLSQVTSSETVLQPNEQVSDVESLTGQEVNEADFEEQLEEEKYSDTVCVNDDIEEEEVEEFTEEEGESFEDEYDEDEDDIMEVEEDELELAAAAVPSSHKGRVVEPAKITSATSVRTAVARTGVVSSQSSDDSDILEIGGNETIADFVGNETICAIARCNESKKGDQENILKISEKERLQISVLTSVDEEESLEVEKETDVKTVVNAASVEKVTTTKTEEEPMEVEEVVAKSARESDEESGEPEDGDEEELDESSEEISDEEDVSIDEEEVEEEEVEEEVEEEEVEERVGQLGHHRSESVSDADEESIICLNSSESEGEPPDSPVKPVGDPLGIVSEYENGGVVSTTTPLDIPGETEDAELELEEGTPAQSPVSQTDETLADVESDTTPVVVSTTQENTSKLEDDSKTDMNLSPDNQNLDAHLVKETSLNVESKIPVMEKVDSPLATLSEVDSSSSVNLDIEVEVTSQIGNSQIGKKAGIEVLAVAPGEQTPVVTQEDAAIVSVDVELEPEVVGVSEAEQSVSQPSISTTTDNIALVSSKTVDDDSINVAPESTVSETVEECRVSQSSPELILQLSESSREEDSEMMVDVSHSHEDKQITSVELQKVDETHADSKTNILSSGIQISSSEHREIASPGIVVEEATSMELDAEPSAEISMSIVEEEVNCEGALSDVSSNPLDKAFVDASESSLCNNSLSVSAEEEKSETSSDSSTAAVDKAVSVAVDNAQPQVEPVLLECEPLPDSDLAVDSDNKLSSNLKENISEENKLQSNIKVVEQQCEATQLEGDSATPESEENKAIEKVCIDIELPMQRRTASSVSSEPPILHDVLESDQKQRNGRGKRAKSELSDNLSIASLDTVPSSSKDKHTASRRESWRGISSRELRYIENSDVLETFGDSATPQTLTRSRRRRSDLGNIQLLQEVVKSPSRTQKTKSVETSSITKESCTKPNGRHEKSDPNQLEQAVEEQPTPKESKRRRSAHHLEVPVSSKGKVGRSRPHSICADDHAVDMHRLIPKKPRAKSLHGGEHPSLPLLQLVKIDPLVGIFTKGRHTGHTPAAQTTSSRAVKGDRSPTSSDSGSAAAIMEFAASRRLTRHQRAVLERSGDSSFRSHSSSSSQQDVVSGPRHTSPLSEREPSLASNFEEPSPPSEKIVTPTRKSRRTKASSKASECDSPTSSIVSEAGSSVYALRSKRGQSEPPLKVTPPRRKRKNVLIDEKEDEVHDEDTSSVASGISEDTASDISKARSVDGHYVGKSHRLTLETAPSKKRTRSVSETNLNEVAASTSSQSPARRSSRIPLKSQVLETIKEESLHILAEEKTPAQRKRSRKVQQGTPFIPPLTEEEKQIAENRLRELRPSMPGPSQRNTSRFSIRKSFQLAVVKKKRH